jgi:hypothetical protein
MYLPYEYLAYFYSILDLRSAFVSSQTHGCRYSGDGQRRDYNNRDDNSRNNYLPPYPYWKVDTYYDYVAIQWSVLTLGSTLDRTALALKQHFCTTLYEYWTVIACLQQS